MARLSDHAFNPMEVFADSFRCIAMDLRNANGGQSHGPLETDPPWGAFSDDQLGLLAYLARVIHGHGFCIVGIAKLEQLQQAADAVNKGPLSGEALARVREIQAGFVVTD